MYSLCVRVCVCVRRYSDHKRERFERDGYRGAPPHNYHSRDRDRDHRDRDRDRDRERDRDRDRRGIDKRR